METVPGERLTPLSEPVLKGIDVNATRGEKMAQETRRPEYEMAINAYRKEQREMQQLVYRMLGSYAKPRTSLKERRREMAKGLEGISVSRMIIEAR